MKKNMESPYPQRRRNAVLIGIAAALSVFAVKEMTDDPIKCEGNQTVTFGYKYNPDGSINYENNYTIWEATTDNVKFDSNTINKQDVIYEIKKMNPDINNLGNIAVGQKIEMPLSCKSN